MSRHCRLLVPDKVGVAAPSKALASGAAVASIQRLDSLGVKYRRPLDYYAEMVKTDYHMDKVRHSLLSSSCELQSAVHSALASAVCVLLPGRLAIARRFRLVRVLSGVCQVKDRLIHEKQSIVDAEDRRKQRDAKKFGKQVPGRGALLSWTELAVMLSRCNTKRSSTSKPRRRKSLIRFPSGKTVREADL